MGKREMLKFISEHSAQLDDYDLKPLYNKIYFNIFRQETGINIYISKEERNNTFKYPILQYRNSTSTPPVINTEFTPDQNIRELNAYLLSKDIEPADYLKLVKFEYLFKYLRIEEETNKISTHNGKAYLFEFIQREIEGNTTEADHWKFMDDNQISNTKETAGKYKYKDVDIQIFKNGYIKLSNGKAIPIIIELKRLRAIYNQIIYNL